MLKYLIVLLAVSVAGCRATYHEAGANGSDTSTSIDASDALDGFSAALKMISPGVMPDDPQAWTDAKIDIANADLQRATGRPVVIQLTAREIIRWKKGFALNGDPKEPYAGDIAFWIYFQPANARSAALINLGETVTVKGKLNSMRFEQRPGSPRSAPRLYVEVDNAAIVR